MIVRTFKIKISDYLNVIHEFADIETTTTDYITQQSVRYVSSLFEIPKLQGREWNKYNRQNSISLQQSFAFKKKTETDFFLYPKMYGGLQLPNVNTRNFDFHLFSFYSAYSWFNEDEFSETFEWTTPIVFDFTGQNFQLNGGTRVRFDQFKNTITKVCIISDGIHNMDKVEKMRGLLRENNGIQIVSNDTPARTIIDDTNYFAGSHNVNGNLISFASKNRLMKHLIHANQHYTFALNCNLVFKLLKNSISIESDGIIEHIASIDSGKIMFIKNENVEFKQNNMFFQK